MSIHSQPVSALHGMWEQKPEAYRTYFWSRDETPIAMWECEPVRITGTEDVAEVIEWARSDGRQFTIYAEVSRPHQDGLVLVHGIDPTGVD